MFENLTLDILKDLIKQYRLSTQIKLSKLIDGKRKTLTKKELANEIHKHLEIREDGEIIYKPRESFKIKKGLEKKIVDTKIEELKEIEKKLEERKLAPKKLKIKIKQKA